MHRALRPLSLALLGALAAPATAQEGTPPPKPAPAPAPAPKAQAERIAERIRAAQEEARLQQRRQLRNQSLALSPDDELGRLVDGLDYDDETVDRAIELLAQRGLEARSVLPRLGERLVHELRVARQRRLVAAMLAIDPMHPVCASAHHFRLCNGTERERREAALALGALGAAASPALRSLVSATREEDTALVRDAVTALGMLGATARDALPRLRELRASKDEQLAQRAGVAIEQIEAAVAKAAAGVEREAQRPKTPPGGKRAPVRTTG